MKKQEYSRAEYPHRYTGIEVGSYHSYDDSTDLKVRLDIVRHIKKKNAETITYHNNFFIMGHNNITDITYGV